MREFASIPPILVAVLGNELAGEDAIGPWVGWELARRELPDVETLDAATDPSRLLQSLRGRRMLVIVDAVASEDTACGQTIDCAWSEASAALSRGARLSTHGLCVADQLRLAAALGDLPPVVWLVGVTAGDFAPGRADAERMRPLARAAADRVEQVIATHSGLETTNA